jgi:ABC-type transporter Mla subunit MlaD
VLPGLTVLAGLVVTSTVVFFLDEVERAIAEGPRITVTAARTDGLEPGSNVWVAGRPAGRVLSVRFAGLDEPQDKRVRIEAVLLRESASLVRRDARARIGASSLLAPPVLKIDPGTSAERLGPSDTLRASVGLPIGRYRALADSARAARARLDSMQSRLAAHLSSGRGSLARFRNDSSTTARLADALRRTRTLRTAVARSPGLTRLLRSPGERRETAAGFRRALDLLEPGRWRAARDSLRALAVTAASVQARLDSLAGGLDAARGTAGRWARDGALRREAEEARAAIRTLPEALMRDPLRWLRLRPF